MRSPADEIIERLRSHGDGLRQKAKSAYALADAVFPGEVWVNVRDVDLSLGTVYVVRRRFSEGRVGHPGLSRWTRNGWRDEYGDPLSDRGVGVDVLVPNGAN